jgi:hypothetical protein
MEINANSRINWLPSLPPAGATRSAQEADGDKAVFEEVTKLKRAFEATADVRPTAVARARTLLGDVNYPPMETIQKIGELLAVHFGDALESSPSTES